MARAGPHVGRAERQGTLWAKRPLLLPSWTTSAEAGGLPQASEDPRSSLGLGPGRLPLGVPRSSHPSAAAQSEESVTANVRSRPRALRRTACACRRRAGPAASPPAPSGLASRVSPRPRATLPAIRSAVWSQGRRRKRRPLCTAAPPPVSAASRGHPDRRGSTSCGCAGTCPLPAVCGAACSHVSARRPVGMGLCRGACSVPCVSDTEALAAGRQLPLTCLLFPLPNKVLMLTRSFSWEEWARFLCRLQPVNTGCLFTWVCPRQHFTISSMYFCVCLVKFTPKCPTFWGLAVNGTVLIPAPRVCCWVHPAGRPPWPCIP